MQWFGKWAVNQRSAYFAVIRDCREGAQVAHFDASTRPAKRPCIGWGLVVSPHLALCRRCPFDGNLRDSLSGRAEHFAPQRAEISHPIVEQSLSDLVLQRHGQHDAACVVEASKSRAWRRNTGVSVSTHLLPGADAVSLA